MPSEDMAFVGDLKKAIIATFKRFKTFDSSELQLFKLVGSSRTLLDPTHTLSEAGIVSSTKLEVAIEGQGACECLLTH